MKIIFLNSIKALLIACSLLLTISSCTKEEEQQKPITFEGYEINNLENATAEEVDGVLQITKIDESLEDFKFTIKPLTEIYWINVIFDNLAFTENDKIKVDYVANSEGNEFVLTQTMDWDKMEIGSEFIGKPWALQGIYQGGDWANPDIEAEGDSILAIWPWVGRTVLSAATKYVLSKLDAKFRIEYDSNDGWSGEAGISWDGHYGGIDSNGDEFGSDKELKSYELTMQNNINPNIAPETIDGVTYTCTELKGLRIKDIINGRL